jgi:RNA polymerase sigma factor (TIGR02999 family)
MLVRMLDVTRVLSQIDAGDSAAAAQLLPLIYDELRKLAAAKLAHETPGQTLQATSLVHEAYLRLVGGEAPERWNGRGHFFGAAAEAMRRILIEHARSKNSVKRGGERQRCDLAEMAASSNPRIDDLLDLDEALTRLAKVDSAAAKLVELRVFAGMTVEEAAEHMNLSPRTSKRMWAYARAWLRREVGAGVGSNA